MKAEWESMDKVLINYPHLMEEDVEQVQKNTSMNRGSGMGNGGRGIPSFPSKIKVEEKEITHTE